VQVHKIVSALSEAAGDERVKGLIAYVGTSAAGAGLAVTQELRAAVQIFRWGCALAEFAANLAYSGMLNS
jgi:hypothetical protein